MSKIEDLAQLLAQFPGIGKRTAQRLVFFILKQSPEYCLQLGREISQIKSFIKPCTQCGYFSDQNPCEICKNSNRDTSKLCIVSVSQDVMAFESSDIFTGLYHVLGGLLSPIDGMGPEQLSFLQLSERLSKKDPITQEYIVQELILATPPTLEGESTARYIKTYLVHEGLSCTRIALGIPMGGDFEYVDKHTLSHSFFARREMD